MAKWSLAEEIQRRKMAEAEKLGISLEDLELRKELEKEGLSPESAGARLRQQAKSKKLPGIDFSSEISKR